ncbi:hypothetical protein GOP47_0027058 [Adiantum capillus-veneris]|nr:hypothetical protein GOP47_0027058 [Adiantum capillus-veneris]
MQAWISSLVAASTIMVVELLVIVPLRAIPSCLRVTLSSFKPRSLTGNEKVKPYLESESDTHGICKFVSSSLQGSSAFLIKYYFFGFNHHYKASKSTGASAM